MTAAEAEPLAGREPAVNALLAVYDRPSAGSRCSRCGDWGTVVLWRGHTSYEVICPADGCAAAVQARQLRESA